MLVWDASKPETLNRLDQWIEQMKQDTDISNIILYLVANKIDLAEDLEDIEERQLQFANSHNITYMSKTSAKTGDGIVDVFNQIAQAVYDKRVSSEREKEEEKLNITK